MPGRRGTFLILVLATLSMGGHLLASVKQIDKEIKGHKKDLEEIKDQIRDLESEKTRLKKDETDLKNNLRKIESDIQRSKKKQSRQKGQILETQKMMEHITKQIDFFSSERLRWERSIFADLRTYHARFVFPRKLVGSPMADRAMRELISLKYGHMRNADTMKDMAVEKEKEHTETKTKLVRLKDKLEKEIRRQKKSQASKSRLYKTTQGKRIIAEREVKRLRETSEGLKKLISKLAARKKKNLEARRRAELMKRSFREKKGKLSWPVGGTVISKFGRQKHPDLDITVINNGVRIQTLPNSDVRSVERGTVVYAADFRSYGQTVIVDHGGDAYSVYGLLGSLSVKEGQDVTAMNVLGTADSGENPQIYFEIRNQGKSVNPILWLK